MEVFYKLTESILEKQVVESYEGKKFYQSLISLLYSDKSMIEKEIADGIVVGFVFTTFTPEREKYLKDKKILYNLTTIENIIKEMIGR